VMPMNCRRMCLCLRRRYNPDTRQLKTDRFMLENQLSSGCGNNSAAFGKHYSEFYIAGTDRHRMFPDPQLFARLHGFQPRCSVHI
jgi:hypothetical protein